MNPLQVLFAGSGEFAVPTLRSLVDGGQKMVKVVTQPDRPAGRGRAMTQTPTGHAADSFALRVIKTDDINGLSDAELPAADVMVVIAFGQKISDAVIQRFRLGAINLHASRLPRYRGAAPINWAILSGETISGNSVIRLAQKMDAGAILAQSELAIGPLETAGELHDRLALDGAGLVLNVLEALAVGTAVEREQDHSKATIARKLSREAARINWDQDASRIAWQIRGMYPWPGCRVELREDEKVLDLVTLVRGRASEGKIATAPAGTLAEGDGFIGIVAGDGRLVEVIELQPAGKRSMPIEAYRRGHPWKPGMTVHSI